MPIRLRQTPTAYSGGCALDAVAEMGGEPPVRCQCRHGGNRTFDFWPGLADGGRSGWGMAVVEADIPIPRAAAYRFA